MIYTGEFVGLIRTIAILVIVYYAFRFIRIYLLPKAGVWAINRMQQKMQEQSKRAQRTTNPNETVSDNGNVKVERLKNYKRNSLKPTQDPGEYIDFEEVD